MHTRKTGLRGIRARAGLTGWQTLVIAAAAAAVITASMPALVRARSRAGAATCVTNLRQIGRATGLYLQDYDQTFPYAYGQQNVHDWYGALSSYLKVKHDPKGKDDWERRAAVFHCPLDDNGPSPVSYATNALVSGAEGFEHQPAERLSRIAQPERVVWVGETNKIWSRQEGFYDTITDWVRPEEDLGYPKTDDRAYEFYRTWLRDRDWTDLRATALGCPDGLYRCKYPSFRHGRTGPRTGYANFVFTDGHAKAVPWGTLTVSNLFPNPTQSQLDRYDH